MHDTWLRNWKFFVTDETITSDLIDGEFQELQLPRDVIDKIYHKNAQTWFGTFK